ncbi:hypothetical protein RFI_01975 [Reticulomyxa filosa]|uniref:Uncharacterized protein n=1 Tax=Reticulomyxa filosa TaxID=46433 RepID=X6PAA5_RETFI|nr:hypothetical protein RFI_01975 [Reticulomyxa filosa]|eukprot:ETO35101.1 hypothetical protein RFI_01975 [Reticulomyxa filosa]
MEDCKQFQNDRDHSICENYKHIALLSVVGKLLERIVTMILIWYLNEHQMLQNTSEFTEQAVLNGNNSSIQKYLKNHHYHHYYFYCISMTSIKQFKIQSSVECLHMIWHYEQHEEIPKDELKLNENDL